MEYFKEGVRFKIIEQYPYVSVSVTKEDVILYAKTNGFTYCDFENSMVARSGLTPFMNLVGLKYGWSNNFRKLHGHKKIKRDVLIEKAKVNSNCCSVYSYDKQWAIAKR